MRTLSVMCRITALLLCAQGTGACTAARCQWRDPALAGARDADASLPKRLAVVGWSRAAQQNASIAAPASAPVGDVMARVAADFIKLRRNYLVYETAVVQKSFAEACRDKVEGVLLVRAREADVRKGGQVHLNLSVALYTCRDGALVFRVEGSTDAPAHSADLAQLTDSYASALGEPARPYVAPAFSLLQDLFSTLPDVTLNDAEIEEKIELGMRLPLAGADMRVSSL